MSLIRTSQEFSDWLTEFSAKDPKEYVTPPGLGGIWQVRWLNDGIDCGAVVVHHAGLGYALTQGKQTDQWMARMRAADANGPPSKKQFPDLPTGKTLPDLTLEDF